MARVVIPEVKFAEITVQVLFSYMEVYTVYTVLENLKIALNRICADKNIILFKLISIYRPNLRTLRNKDRNIYYKL